MKKHVYLTAVVAVLIFIISSCAVFEKIFQSNEKIPKPIKQRIELYAKDVLPVNLTELLPTDLKSFFGNADMLNIIKNKIPAEIIENVINNHYNNPNNVDDNFTVSEFINFESSVSEHFDSVKIPRVNKYLEYRHKIDKTVFEDVQKQLEERSKEIFLNPKLEINDLNLHTDITLNMVHPQLDVEIMNGELDLKVSKSENGLNSRDFVELDFENGVKSSGKIDDDCKWMLISLMNAPGDMYVTACSTLAIDLGVKNIDFDADIEFSGTVTLDITVNDVNNPVSAGYEWNIIPSGDSAFKLMNSRVSGFDLNGKLLILDMVIDGEVTAGIKFQEKR